MLSTILSNKLLVIVQGAGNMEVERYDGWLVLGNLAQWDTI